MKLLFCGTPDFAASILGSLAGSGHSIVGVLTQPEKARGRGKESSPSPVARAAEKAGIPVNTGSPSKPETMEWTRKLAPEASVVAAYGRIFRKEFLDLPPLGVLNVHPSLLPRWRGASPIHSALLAGDAVTGVCIMKLVEELDAGPVYARKEVPVLPGDDRASLETKLAELGASLLAEALDSLAAGAARALPQSEAGVTYCPKLLSDDEKIAWGETALACWNRVRAFAPAPGASFALMNAETCKVLEASPLPPAGGERSVPGRVLGPGQGKGLLVGCGGDSVLNLLRVRPAGKKDQSGADLLHGKKLRVGDILPF